MTLKKGLIALALVFLSLAAICILFFDQSIAQRLSHAQIDVPRLIRIQRTLDWVTLKFISALVGPVLLIIGAVLWRQRSAELGRFLIGWGGAITITEYSIDLMKWVFGRLRPYQWLNAPPEAALWFAGGTSFPSGHAGYYAAVAGGLAIRFPRYAPYLLLVPVFVATQRVLSGMHYLSDVLTGIAMALIAAAIMADWLRPPTISRKL